MSTTPRIVADFETQLATAIAVGGTSFTLSSVTDDDGVSLPAGTYCFTIDNGTSVKEYLMGTLSGSTVSSVQSISRQGAATSGAARAHRVGASVIITDFIAIKRVADILAGDDTLDGTSPLIYDTAPTLSDPKEVATVAYVLSVVTGGTVYFSSQTINATAGEGLAAPNIVYFKTSDQRWWKADADDSATYSGVRLGVAQSTATAGNGVTIQLSGIATGFTSLTPGAAYYLSGTAGGVTSTAPASSVFIGWAVSATTILLAFQEIYRPNKVQKDFLNGVTGQIIMFGSSTAPTGFLNCDGSAVSRTTYAALFAVIGTSYGDGDGSSTFNLPDLRGRLPVGYSSGARTKVLTFASRSSDTITVTGDPLTNSALNEVQTGQPVTYHTTSGVITGLSNDTVYYLIRVAYNQFKLASSVQNANAGTAISLSSDGTGTQTFTITATAQAMGAEGGTETQTNVPRHAHTTNADYEDSGGGGSGGTGGDPLLAATINPAGENAPSNMPPFVVVNYMIKT